MSSALNRRAWLLSSASTACAVAALSGVAPQAWAQAGEPVAGQDYVKLAQPVGVSTPTGKIEVVEFFWYGCPHCFQLDPLIEGWVKTLPADVVFRRVPVGFSVPHEAHQKLFYGLQALNKLDEANHRKIFQAIQVDRKRLMSDAEQAEFVAGLGVDPAAYAKVLKEFHVQTKIAQAKQLAAAYKIDGVPAIGVQGRYYTAASMAGSHKRSLEVANHLIALARKGG